MARPVTVDTPYVSADVLVHEDGRRFVWLVSQSPDTLTVRPRGGRLFGLGTGTESPEVTLEPYGVQVLELRQSDVL